MTSALLVTVLLCAVTGLSLLAKRFNVPYPVAFVIGGTLLAFVPGLPQITLDPNLVFLLILPPLLFGAAWSTDWVAFKRNARPIGFLAIGLVIFTTVIVAVVAHALLPSLSWALSFVLGAIVSPPDAVAAESVLARLSVPRRLAAILTGESLVNDASALVIYRFAVAAVLYGAFSLPHAVIAFVFVSLGGIAIGFAIAGLVEVFFRLLRKSAYADSTTTNVVSLVAPYLAYLPAESIHVSGVLSVVTAGMILGRRSAHFLDSESRLIGGAVWGVFTYILNGFVFIVIGLQLRGVIADIAGNASKLDGPVHVALHAVEISILVIVIRIGWVFAATYLQRAFSKALRERDPTLSWRTVLVVAWTGMRGIVSLASALAVPVIGVAVAARSEIIFITFCVIFATLVLQGCTLAPLIRWLGIAENSSRELQETKVRIHALEAGVARLHLLEPTFDSPLQWEIAGRVLGEYSQRIDHLRGHLTAAETDEPPENRVDHLLQNEALKAERTEILALRAAGNIPDDVFRNIQYDLDIADMRLS